MRNAAKEFSELYFPADVICATISINGKVSNLKIDHNEKDLGDFLHRIDVEYDNGYGSQELYGNIWLEDGTWYSRWEYDGSEGWKYNKCPEIPQKLKKKKING